MMYKYENGVFMRVDNCGVRYNIDLYTAHDICKLAVQGFSSKYIKRSLDLDISTVTLDSFIRNFEEGNIIDLHPQDFENVVWYERIREKFKKWVNK